MGLFLESSQEGGKLEGDCEVGGELSGTVKDKTEVEEKFIALILGWVQADWVPNDAVGIRNDGKKAGAKFLTGYDVGWDIWEVKKGNLRRARGGHNRVGGDLVKDFGA